jgi:hypothetical protein
MKELIVVTDRSRLRVLNLREAVTDGWLCDARRSFFGDHSLDVYNEELGELENLSEQAPNLALNIEGAVSPSRELWTYAGIGALLQTVAIVIPAISTFIWKFPKASALSRLTLTLAFLLESVLSSPVQSFVPML